MVEVVVPQMSEVASEIVLVRWLKSEGDSVHKGEPLFELDTDKYVVEIEAFEDGTLAEIVVAAGAVVEPGQVVAKIRGDGVSGGVTEAAPAATVQSSAPRTIAGEQAPSRRKVLASPKARRLAQELGLDVTVLTGSGSGGLITSDDVRKAADDRPVEAVTDHDLEPLSDARRVIGARMQDSKQTVPHFYVMADVDMSDAVRLREHSTDALGWQRPPTYTDLIVAACARAFRDVPDLNVRLDGDGLRRRATIDIGIAVGSEEGLIVPVLERVDRLGLRTLSTRTREAVARARAGRLLASDLIERSMVVSNLGMHGVDAFIAIVDKPDPMILAAGRVAQRCVVVDGVPSVTWQCTLSLSADHRVLDGFGAARFLGAVERQLQDCFAFLQEEA
jgi:pyruvate dehydrogenase E2 component (dihydrolipoamide acetyltransferase)